MQTIGDAVVRIETAAESMERQARLLDRETIQKMLALNISKDDVAQLPCCVLPVARNSRFFGREDLLSRIDGHLQPETE